MARRRWRYLSAPAITASAGLRLPGGTWTNRNVVQVLAWVTGAEVVVDLPSSRYVPGNPANVDRPASPVPYGLNLGEASGGIDIGRFDSRHEDPPRGVLTPAEHVAVPAPRVCALPLELAGKSGSKPWRDRTGGELPHDPVTRRGLGGANEVRPYDGHHSRSRRVGCHVSNRCGLGRGDGRRTGIQDSQGQGPDDQELNDSSAQVDILSIDSQSTSDCVTPRAYLPPKLAASAEYTTVRYVK